MQIEINDLNLEQIGSVDGGTPESVLLGKMKIGNAYFHVEAFQVEEKRGKLRTVNPSCEENLEGVRSMLGDVEPTTVEINGLQYVMFVCPHAV